MNFAAAKIVEGIRRRSLHTAGKVENVSTVVDEERSKRGTDEARILALEAALAALALRVAELERVRG